MIWSRNSIEDPPADTMWEKREYNQVIIQSYKPPEYQCMLYILSPQATQSSKVENCMVFTSATDNYWLLSHTFTTKKLQKHQLVVIATPALEPMHNNQTHMDHVT